MSRRGGSGDFDGSELSMDGSSSSRTSGLETPWTRARKLRSQMQEERLNTLPGGQKGVNSGRIWRFKRDGRIHDFLIEARTNEKPGAKSYRIEKAEFLELRREALTQPGGMKPGMQVTIDDLDLMVIELSVFTEMYNHLLLLAERDTEK
jgi:hypothetical protein